MAGPVLDGEVVWQVEYDDLVGEGTVWWDLPKLINDYIEEQSKTGRNVIIYNWPWQQKDHVIYELDTNTKEVRNTQTDHKRRVRRVLILNFRNS